MLVVSDYVITEGWGRLAGNIALNVAPAVASIGGNALTSLGLLTQSGPLLAAGAMSSMAGIPLMALRTAKSIPNTVKNTIKEEKLKQQEEKQQMLQKQVVDPSKQYTAQSIR